MLRRFKTKLRTDGAFDDNQSTPMTNRHPGILHLLFSYELRVLVRMGMGMATRLCQVPCRWYHWDTQRQIQQEALVHHMYIRYQLIRNTRTAGQSAAAERWMIYNIAQSADRSCRRLAKRYTTARCHRNVDWSTTLWGAITSIDACKSKDSGIYPTKY